jgi:hypothetical protein
VRLLRRAVHGDGVFGRDGVNENVTGTENKTAVGTDVAAEPAREPYSFFTAAMSMPALG